MPHSPLYKSRSCVGSLSSRPKCIQVSPPKKIVVEKPKKRSLGKVTLYPSSYCCPFLDRLVHGEICHDGVQIAADGNVYREYVLLFVHRSVVHNVYSVHEWVRAEGRRQFSPFLSKPVTFTDNETFQKLSIVDDSDSSRSDDSDSLLGWDMEFQSPLAELSCSSAEYCSESLCEHVGQSDNFSQNYLPHESYGGQVWHL